MKFMIAAVRNTAYHPPVASLITFANGTSSADAPFAV